MSSAADKYLEMTIYFDISAAVHRRAGLGRYAESLARALLPLLGDELAFFYNREAGIEPLAGLEGVPAATVTWATSRGGCWYGWGRLADVGFDRLVPGATLFHATEHLLLPLHGVPTVLTVHDLIFRRYPAAPQAAQPLVSQRDHAALLPPRRRTSSRCRSRANGTSSQPTASRRRRSP